MKATAILISFLLFSGCQRTDFNPGGIFYSDQTQQMVRISKKNKVFISPLRKISDQEVLIGTLEPYHHSEPYKYVLITHSSSEYVGTTFLYDKNPNVVKIKWGFTEKFVHFQRSLSKTGL